MAYAGWIALSIAWAPVADFAGDDAERALLYAVVLAAAALAFRARAAARALEPLAAAGTVVVIGYGLAGRLLPGLVTEHPQVERRRAPGPAADLLERDRRAGGDRARAVRAPGGRPRARPPAPRGAAAAAVPLGMGCYLSFSRGALAALAAGLIALRAGADARAAARVRSCGGGRAGGRPRRRAVAGGAGAPGDGRRA